MTIRNSQAAKIAAYGDKGGDVTRYLKNKMSGALLTMQRQREARSVKRKNSAADDAWGQYQATCRPPMLIRQMTPETATKKTTETVKTEPKGEVQIEKIPPQLFDAMIIWTLGLIVWLAVLGAAIALHQITVFVLLHLAFCLFVLGAFYASAAPDPLQG